MRNTIKKQKGFIQIPLLAIVIFLALSVCAGVIFPNITRAVIIKIPLLICIPEDEPDPETGCRACGDNARIKYEQCRQAYYLKKQNEILEQQQDGLELQQENTQLKLQLQTLQRQLESQQKEIATLTKQVSQKQKGLFTLTLQSIPRVYLLIVLTVLVIGVVIAILTRKKWFKK